MASKRAPGPGTYENKPRGGEQGYIRICVGPQRDKYVHTLVAEAKLGRALLPHETVEHDDGNRQNNAPGNIKVVTRPDNTRLMLQRNGSPLATAAAIEEVK